MWVGTDDGQVQRTINGGQSWKNVTAGIAGVPQGTWVGRVEASKFDPMRAYVTFDGHRSDLFDTWIFVTEDGGSSWRSITNGITQGEVVRVIREDHVDQNLLFAGTETGVWYSIDRGINWTKMKQGLPTVSVYDIKIHPRDHDLIIGTHGRSLWVMDDISPLRDIKTLPSDQKVHLFDQRPTTLWENVSRGGQRGHFLFAGENPANIINTSSLPRATFDMGVALSFYVTDPTCEEVNMKVYDRWGEQLVATAIPCHHGLNRYIWNRQLDSPPLSTDQKAMTKKILDNLKRDVNSSYVARLINRYDSAEDDAERRRIIHPFVSDYRGAKFPPHLGLSYLDAGVYVVTLESGGQTTSTRLVLREDPMGE